MPEIIPQAQLVQIADASISSSSSSSSSSSPKQSTIIGRPSSGSNVDVLPYGQPIISTGPTTIHSFLGSTGMSSISSPSSPLLSAPILPHAATPVSPNVVVPFLINPSTNLTSKRIRGHSVSSLNGVVTSNSGNGNGGSPSSGILSPPPPTHYLRDKTRQSGTEESIRLLRKRSAVYERARRSNTNLATMTAQTPMSANTPTRRSPLTTPQSLLFDLDPPPLPTPTPTSMTNANEEDRLEMSRKERRKISAGLQSSSTRRSLESTRKTTAAAGDIGTLSSSSLDSPSVLSSVPRLSFLDKDPMESPTTLVTPVRDHHRPLSAPEREAVRVQMRNSIRHWKRPSMDEPSSQEPSTSYSSSSPLAHLSHRPRSSDSSLSISSSNTNSSAFASSLEPCNKPSSRSSLADLAVLSAFTPTNPLSPFIRTHSDDCLAPEERCTCEPHLSPRSASSTPLSAVAHAMSSNSSSSSSSSHAHLPTPTTTTIAGQATPITPTSPTLLFDVQKRRRAHAFDHFASYSEMMPKPKPIPTPTPTSTPTSTPVPSSSNNNSTSVVSLSQQQQPNVNTGSSSSLESGSVSAAPTSFRFPDRIGHGDGLPLPLPPPTRTQSWHVVQSVPNLHTTTPVLISREASSTRTSLTSDESRSGPPPPPHSHYDVEEEERGRGRESVWDGSSASLSSMAMTAAFPIYRTVSHDSYERRARSAMTATFTGNEEHGKSGRGLMEADFQFIKGLRNTYHEASHHHHHHHHRHHHTHSHDAGYNHPTASSRWKSTKLWKRRGADVTTTTPTPPNEKEKEKGTGEERKCKVTKALKSIFPTSSSSSSSSSSSKSKSTTPVDGVGVGVGAIDSTATLYEFK